MNNKFLCMFENKHDDVIFVCCKASAKQEAYKVVNEIKIKNYKPITNMLYPFEFPLSDEAQKEIDTLGYTLKI